jgi:hypothetical protein
LGHRTIVRVSSFSIEEKHGSWRGWDARLVQPSTRPALCLARRQPIATTALFLTSRRGAGQAIGGVETANHWIVTRGEGLESALRPVYLRRSCAGNDDASHGARWKKA